jgi:hypothetical protein
MAKRKKSWVDRISDSTNNYMKNSDAFGQTVNFNFAGNPNAQTAPGGYLSVFINICLIGYILLQLKYMLNREEWGLIQQNVLQTEAELGVTHKFKDFTNVSIALQFNQKRKALTKEQMEAYEAA